MDEQTRLLKCRFCRWRIQLYVRKGKKVKDNWPVLADHVARRHPDEFDMIQRSLVNVRAKIQLLSGEEAVDRFPRRGTGSRIKRARQDETPELYFDVN